MKAAFQTLLAVAIICAIGAIAYAEDDKDKKEVEYKGDLGCPKCTFKMDKSIHGGKCMNAIRYKEKKDDKAYKYVVIIDKGKDEDYHKCSGVKEGVSVKGYVSKKKETKDQLYITPIKDGVKY